jgi:4-hydroxy-tetrahydrodipicolinate reductase
MPAPWIVASNFSLGMNIAFLLTKALANISSLARADFHVREVHHTEKKDSPSGTALFLTSLLPADTKVTSQRIGDAKGLHVVEARLGGEILRVEHEAIDRSVFGAGALYAVENLLPELTGGIHKFENLMEQKLRKELFHV